MDPVHPFIIMINLSAGDIFESEILEFYDIIVTEDSKAKFPTLNDLNKLIWVGNIPKLSKIVKNWPNSKISKML